MWLSCLPDVVFNLMTLSNSARLTPICSSSTSLSFTFSLSLSICSLLEAVLVMSSLSKWEEVLYEVLVEACESVLESWLEIPLFAYQCFHSPERHSFRTPGRCAAPNTPTTPLDSAKMSHQTVPKFSQSFDVHYPLITIHLENICMHVKDR